MHSVARALLAILTLSGCVGDTVLLAPPGAAEFGPRQLTFEETPVGRSVTETAYLYNLTEAPLAIDGLSVDPAGGFTLPTGPVTLPAGGRVPVPVTFLPTRAGPFTAVVRAHPASGRVAELAVTGTGVASPDGSISCTGVDFGFVAVGDCASKPVRCDATAFVVATSLSRSPSFDHDATLPSPFGPGDPLDLAVRFCPGASRRHEADLLLETSGGPASIHVTGEGGKPSLVVSPAHIDFGRTEVGAEVTEEVQVENGGDRTLEVELATTDPFALSLGHLTLSPGDSRPVDVRYAPTAPGDQPGTITLASNDPDRPTASVELIGRAEAEPPCSLDITPPSLDFGEVALGDQLILSFAITNEGARTCMIRDLRTSGAGFELTNGAPRSIALDPGASVAVAVRFEPSSSGRFLADARFEAAGGSVAVPLSGRGVASSLTVRPADVDFGVTTPDCPASPREITLDNRGLENVEVTNVTVEPPGSPFIVAAPELPFLVPTDGTRIVSVEYAPTGFQLDLAQLVIEGTIDGLPFERRVGLRGRHSEGGENVDTFVQDQTNQVDVLIVMDNSNTMLEEQAAIGANFASFIQYAEQGGLDYQIGVTTTDVMQEGGRLVPVGAPFSERVITPMSTPSPAELFEQNVDVGTTGALLEQGLEAAYLALSPPVILSDNAGFLRSDAILLLIFVSDENDGSPRPVSFYSDFFLDLKNGDRGLVRAIAIIGDVPAGCATATGGLRYDALVGQVGGDVVSICSTDWSATLSQISQSAFGLRAAFSLSGLPDASTIEVRVDGVLTTGWTYEVDRNQVVFTQLPPQGATIEIRYDLDCP